jgi:hypothetical protein
MQQISETVPTLIFIDSAVHNYQFLVDQVHDESQVIIISPDQNGIEQITQSLTHCHSLTSIHIVSHGVSGSLQLGSAWLNLNNFDNYLDQISTWGRALAAQAKIWLYGCHVAATETGKQFVRQLSDLTNSTIIASETATGHSSLGGNWQLEFSTGLKNQPESQPIFRQNAIQNYPYILAPDALPNLIYTINNNKIFYTSISTGGNLTPISPATGNPVSNTLAFATQAVARDPLSPNQILYYISSGSNKIGTWDPVTGTSVDLAAITGATLTGAIRMAFRDNGQLYAMVPNSNNLYVISTGTGLGTGNTAPAGTATLVGAVAGLPATGGGDMAFDPANPNDLYIAFGGTLYKVTFTGSTPSAATPIGSGTLGTSAPGLAFGPDGNLYGSNGTNLVRIDLTNGSQTTIASIGISSNDFATLPTPSPDVDLKITVTDSKTTTAPGSPVTYTITVTNTSGYNVRGVSIVDNFTDPHLSGTPTWTATTAAGVSFPTAADQSGTGNINVKVNLAAGASVTYTVTGLTATGAVGTIISDTATTSPPEGITDKATNPGSNTATDTTTIDTPPVVTVNSLITNDNTPALTGTVSITTATVKVTVNGQTYTAKNNGNGTWTLADNTITTALADGTYDVKATATSTYGSTGTDTTTNELTVDTKAPTVAVTPLTTKDNTPQLTGTVDDPTAIVKVTVNGQTYTAKNNGDGTWTLADNTITTALADGTYNVTATATDTAGNIGTDATTNELTVDTKAPVVTVTPLTTKDNTPQLTGTVDDPAVTIKVTVNGQTYTAKNNGDGTWTLADKTITTPLPDGIYNVTATATDPVGNVGTDNTTNELTVDTKAPIVTVNPLKTNDSSPSLTGTVDDPTATVTVTVNRQTYTAKNNGDGTWTLASNTITPALLNGTYDITATATDTVGNIGTDPTNNELTVDTKAPSITVNPLKTKDNTPQLSGTVSDPNAAIQVTIGRQTYKAANNGDGTWTLADNIITPALADGIYNVIATATDPVGNIGTDATNNELTVDTKALTDSVMRPLPSQVDSARDTASYSKTDSTAHSPTVDTKTPSISTIPLRLNNPPQVHNTTLSRVLSNSTVRVRTAINPNNSTLSGFGLTATDTDQYPVASYTILSLPSTKQGKLYLGNPQKGGKAVTVNEVLSPNQIGNLFFKAAPTFHRKAKFEYTATDTLGLTAVNPGTVTITGAKDIIDAGTGSTTLTGSKGNNRYIFQQCKDSPDLITNFKPTKDLIDLSAFFVDCTSTNLYQQYIQISASGTGTLVSVGDRQGYYTPFAVLQNVAPSQVSRSNFLL